MSERNFTVYRHTSPSGKQYVGVTSTSVQRRWRDGKGYKNNWYFWKAIEKYGWDNIQHEILYTNLSRDEAYKIEIELIAEGNLTNHDFGYNLDGGGGGIVTEETRQKQSNARKGRSVTWVHITDEQKSKISATLKEYYATHDNPMKGKHHSAETIAKLKSRPVSEEQKRHMRENHCDQKGAKNNSAKSVVCKTKDGDFVKRYDYAKLAATELGVDLSSIIKCCRGKQKTCGGFVWEYAS